MQFRDAFGLYHAALIAERWENSAGSTLFCEGNEAK